MTITFNEAGVTFNDLTLTMNGDTISPIDTTEIAGSYEAALAVLGSLDQVAVGGDYAPTAPIPGTYDTTVATSSAYVPSIAIAGSYDTTITGGGTP